MSTRLRSLVEYGWLYLTIITNVSVQCASCIYPPHGLQWGTSVGLYTIAGWAKNRTFYLLWFCNRLRKCLFQNVQISQKSTDYALVFFMQLLNILSKLAQNYCAIEMSSGSFKMEKTIFVSVAVLQWWAIESSDYSNWLLEYSILMHAIRLGFDLRFVVIRLDIVMNRKSQCLLGMTEICRNWWGCALSYGTQCRMSCPL